MNFSLLKRCNMRMTVAFPQHSLLISSCPQDLSFWLGCKARGYFPELLCCISVAAFVLGDTGAGGGLWFLSILSDMNVPLIDLPLVNPTNAQ